MTRHLSPRLMRLGRRTRKRQPRLQPRRCRGRGQRGVVLLLALVVLLLIAAIGAALLFMSTSESSIVGSQRVTSRAFYAALGGLEEARYRMLPANQPTGFPPLGLNYTNPEAVVTGTFPIIPCTGPVAPPVAEAAGTLVPCNTVSVIAYPTRPWNVLYIMNTGGPPPGSVPNTPASATNDPLLGNEIPLPIVNSTTSIQPGAGTNASVPWSWVRVNLKTERSSGEDIDLNGTTADDEPIFYYNTRQYRRTDLLAWDPSVLPAPWGPIPPPGVTRPCAATVCATPVYLLTAFATVPANVPTGRIVRAEVAALPAFAINAAILSQPPIGVSGTSEYYGYDQCDPDCAGAPPLVPPPTCNTVTPLQSAAPGGSTISGNSSNTYPPPPCPPPSVARAGACIQESAPFNYNVNDIISMLRPLANNIVAPGLYNGLAMGGFPFGDTVNGVGANPLITYVGGDMKCTAGCSGSGILVVDGNLDFNASMEFYGVIIVRGNVTVLGGGSPTTGCNIYGAMITGGTVDTTVGGDICFKYNTCAQRNMFMNRPFTQLAFREIPE